MGRRLGRPEIGVFFFIFQVTARALALATDLINKYPRILTNFTSIEVLKSCFRDHFLSGIERPVGSEAIANLLNLMPRCRSLMGTSRL